MVISFIFICINLYLRKKITEKATASRLYKKKRDLNPVPLGLMLS